MVTLHLARRLAATAVALVTPGLASLGWALTASHLDPAQMGEIFGRYAPRGDCRAGPVITIDASGFDFELDGRTTHPARFEIAYAFMGQDYDGIGRFFFPFVRGDDDFGATTLTVNADEVPGKLTIANDGPPPISALQQALARASPYTRCGKAPPVRARVAPPPAPPALPVGWAQLPTLVGRYDLRLDLIHRGEIADAIRALIGRRRMAALEIRLYVSGPIGRQGSIYFVSGNAAHQGGVEQAYVLMDAEQRRVQVGLWEGGKLVVHPPPGGRLPVPEPIARLLADSPPEDAVALPGTPWQLMTPPARAPIAFVQAAASQKIRSFSLYCAQGRPVLAMRLHAPPSTLPVFAIWNFAGWTVAVAMTRGNRDATLWLGDLADSELPQDLVTRSGFAYLRLNGELQGQASLIGAATAVRTALDGCHRF
jgi:hypothetical protein